MAGMSSALPIAQALKSDNTAVLVIDVQYDFMEGGALEVPGANYMDYLKGVKEFVADVRSKPNLILCQSRDYHCEKHSSFASEYEEEDPNAEPFTEKELTRPNGEKYKQMLWPDHCIQGTMGSDLLCEPVGDEIVQVKGTRREFDSYSAFIDDGGDKTGLDETLKGKGKENIVLFGLALDYCVYFSAMDAVKCGFKNVYVVWDLCRYLFFETI